MTNPNNEIFEQVSIFDTNALFTSLRIDRDKLPENIFAYEIRGDGMDATQIKEFILVDHMGTLLTKSPINLGDDGFIDIENEDDFYFTDGRNLTLSQFISDEQYEKPKIEVLIVEPNKKPYSSSIENDLVSLQQQVNGYIQIVHPFEANACLICNEEGKILGLPLNREINGDIIAGNFIIAGLDEDGEISSLSDKQIETYKSEFEEIETHEYIFDEDLFER